MIKKYIKDESFDPIYYGKSNSFWAITSIIPKGIVFGGLVLLTSQVIFPLVYFKTTDVTINPGATGTVLGTASGFTDFNFSELSTTTTKTQNGAKYPKYFSLSISKLGITNAIVETNPANLNPDEALGHYIGSAFPGETGNSFIYGHSVLPFFYNPKNYKTIFSTLDQLKVGDTIEINANNKKLVYVVESKNILEPEKVDPLAKIKPDYLNESTITLMTCTPTGTREKRLLVNAVLTKK